MSKTVAKTKAGPKTKAHAKKTLKRPAARVDADQQHPEGDNFAEADPKKKKGNKGVSRTKDEERALKLQELETEHPDKTTAAGADAQTLVRDKQKSQWLHRHLKTLPEEVP